MKMALYLLGLPPQNPQPQSNHEQNREIPVEGRSIKYLISTPQNCQGHQKQGKCEKLSQPRRHDD